MHPALQAELNWRLSGTGLRELQERKLRRLVGHAYAHVPYYRELFQAHGLTPDDIGTLDDLAKIPISRKPDLLASGTAGRVAQGTQVERCIPVRTNGSSGQPIVTYITPAERAWRVAVEGRGMRVIGRRIWERTVVLGPESSGRFPWHQRLGVQRTTVLASRLPPEEQIRRMREIQPQVLWVYPSVLAAVLHQVEYRLSAIVRPRLLISSSEMFEPWLRQGVVNDANPEIFDWYGCMEVGRLAFECPAHRGLHINADHVIVECLVDGQPAPAGQPGRTVITALESLTTPYLRYDLGDTCILPAEPCPCGSAFPLLQRLEGRRWEMVVLPSGKLLSPHFIRYALRRLQWLERFLIVQEARDHLHILLASRESPEPAVLEQISAQCQEATGERLRVTVELVESLDGQMPNLGTFVSRLPDWRPTASGG